jgi:hypothetical protein
MKLSLLEMLEISHALGIDLFKAVMSNKLKDKNLPKEFYRNRFQAESNKLFDDLIDRGFANKQRFLDLNFYYITESGIEQYKVQYNELVKYVSSKNKSIENLKHRINFYCDFYNYRFGSDNAEHVIDYYKKYYINKEYVSHTTKDCINWFKNELKYFHKHNLL